MRISTEQVSSLKKQIQQKTDLTLITLKDFLIHYQKEIQDYYGLGPWSQPPEDDTDVVILCLVDHLPQTKRKRTPKAAGKTRRDKFKHRHTYDNPMNRIHGFVALEECSTINAGKRNIVSISVVGSSVFSSLRGIGSDLMRYAEVYARQIGYTDIVLEVAAQETSEASCEEETDEETDEEIEWSEEELDEEEQELESLKDILAHEFWRKIMRRIDGEIVYNLSKDYISYLIERYFDCVCRPTRPFKEKITVSEEPGENEYGGYWYRKGLEDSKNLRGFYEYLGYREDPRVHTDWRCFGKIPYPAMVKSL